MKLSCFNTRHGQYNNVLKKIKIKRKPKFNTQGRLCICLIEFRNMIMCGIHSMDNYLLTKLVI